ASINRTGTAPAALTATIKKNNAQASPSPFGRGRGEAPGEGRKIRRNLKPSPFFEASPCRARASRPLPEGEGGFSLNCLTGAPRSVRCYRSNSLGGCTLFPRAWGGGFPWLRDQCN